MPRQDLTHITMVLDRSGSMGTIKSETIGGVNKFLEDQKACPGDATFTLVLFDHEYLILNSVVPIRDFPALTDETYVPRGWTALLDAIGRAIVETGDRLSVLPEHDRPSKVYCVIVTDGLENHSKEYNQSKIAEMIKHQQDVYSWQFVYLGANQDAIAVAAGMNINANASMTYAANSVGAAAAFGSSSKGMVEARTSGGLYQFNEVDRETQRKAGVK